MDGGGRNSLFIFSKKYKALISVKSGGYTPRSGFLFTNSLEKIDFENKNVLDIGCGETGILAHYALLRGAKKIIGIDIDPSAISHARSSSNKSQQITWMIGELKNIPAQKFHIILSNPPQMPMSFEQRKSMADWHDSCGDTGRELINKIIKKSPYYLKKEGDLYLLIFDFLGVEKSYNNEPNIKDIANQNGFYCEVINRYKKEIRKGGQTEKNISWIKKLYPNYSFKKNADSSLYYEVEIVRFKSK